jgi:tRNA(Ile)-lysidine synthase
MISQIKKTIEQYKMLDGVHTVVAAVSGGADSVCMLDMLRLLSLQQGFELVCAHFNHNLRGRESDADADFVENLCKKWDIAFVKGSADVMHLAKDQSVGIEEAARLARYEFLRKIAREKKNAVIATAHTANDNAETVLFHLIRGTGIRGVSGISPKKGDVIRPLIHQYRVDVEEYCKTNHLEYVNDSTNADVTYARNRIRHHVLPELCMINDAALDNINRFSRLAASLDAEQTKAGQERYAQLLTPQGLDVVTLAKDPPSYRFATLRAFLEDQGLEADRNLLSRLQDEIEAGKSVSQIPVDAAHFLSISYGFLRLIEPMPAPDPIAFSGESVDFGRYRIGIEKEHYSRRYSLRADVLDGAVLRAAQEDDSYAIPGVGTKSVRRLYIEKKIPRDLRPSWPILVKDGQVVWIYGIGVSAPFQANENEEFINLTVEEKQG